MEKTYSSFISGGDRAIAGISRLVEARYMDLNPPEELLGQAKNAIPAIALGWQTKATTRTFIYGVTIVKPMIIAFLRGIKLVVKEI